MISIRNPVKPLPGMLARNASELNPRLEVMAAPWSISAFGSRTEIVKKQTCAQTRLRMPTTVQRS